MITVEEARKAALEEHHLRWDCEEGCGDDTERAVDTLILAVQAAMPCSNYWVAELQYEGGCPSIADVDWISEADRRPCPSCTARQKLTENEPPSFGPMHAPDDPPAG